MENALTNSLVYLMRNLNELERPVLLASSFMFAKKGFISSHSSTRNFHDIIKITSVGNKAQDKAIQDVYKYITPIYLRLWETVPSAILDFFEALKAMNWNEFNARDFDDMLLGVIGSLGKSSGEYAQPKEITELVTKLLDYRGGRVYNPFSGIASYGAYLKAGDDYFAEELTINAWVVGVSRLILEDAFSENYIIGNSLTIARDNFDYVVSTPPWQMLLRNMEEDIAVKARTSDEFLWKNAIRALKDKGISISVHASSVVYNDSFSGARQELIDHNYLDGIIALPHNIFFGSSISTTIVILRKGREKKSPIKILNATDSSFFFYQQPRSVLNIKRILEEFNNTNETEFLALVSAEDVKKHDYSLSVEDYFASSVNEEHLEIFSNYPSHRLEEICTVAGSFPASLPEIGREIKTSDLSDNPFDIERNAFDIKEVVLRKEQKYRLIDQPALVLSTRFSLKMAYIKASQDNPIYIPNGYLAITLSNIIDYRFLAYQLDCIKSSLFRGAATLNLSLKSLWDAPIPCPPIDEQVTLFKEFARQFKLEKANKLGLADILEEKRKEYETLIRQRKHNMKTPLTEIFNTWKMLDLLVNNSPDMSDMEKLIKLKKYITKQSVSIKDLQKQLNRLTDENKFDEAHELLDIYAFLKQREFSSDKYCIECEMDAAQFAQLELFPVSMVTEDAFIQLFNNIITNAIDHGFNKFKNIKTHGQYHIFIHLGAELSENGARLRIDFINDGKPLPLGLTKEDYGRDGATAGDNGGEGHGGSYVKEMTAFYGGDYDIGRIEDNMSTKTIITVYLPTPQTDNYDTGR